MDNEAALRTAQAKYGDNHWWESDDPRTLAYFQINETCLCVPWERFHAAIEQLLGRPVSTFEFGVNIEGLRQEAEAAFRGTPYSAEGQSANNLPLSPRMRGFVALMARMFPAQAVEAVLAQADLHARERGGRMLTRQDWDAASEQLAASEKGGDDGTEA